HRQPSFALRWQGQVVRTSRRVAAQTAAGRSLLFTSRSLRMHRIGSRYTSVLGAGAPSPFRTTKRLSLESLECRQVMSAAAVAADLPALLDATSPSLALTLAPQQLVSTGTPLGNYVML